MKTFFIDTYNSFSKIVHEAWAVLLPGSYIKYIYKKILHRELDLNDPKDYNEKIEWLKIYSDTSKWTVCADKYKVREYIEECGLKDILVKLYGAWDKAEEIDFMDLPQQFVLKVNHGFGKTILVNDKSKLDIKKTRDMLNKWMKVRYGLVTFEPHYWKIERKIIAEELLQDSYNSELSTSLIDYKFFCINGEPYTIVAMHNRNNLVVGSNENRIIQPFHDCTYDLEWNVRPEILSGSHTKGNPIVLPKPKCFDEMIRICRILSKPFPTVRVDLYEVNSKVYLGELTFTPGGNRNFFLPEVFLDMGEKIDLSAVKRRTKKFII